MPSLKIPDDVRRLILAHIPSVERLEILLLLSDGRKYGWTEREIEEQIRSTTESIAKHLEQLIAAKLAVRDERKSTMVRYRPKSEALDAAVAELALVYRTRRVAVIELIYANRGAKRFSEAFKIGA